MVSAHYTRALSDGAAAQKAQGSAGSASPAGGLPRRRRQGVRDVTENLSAGGLFIRTDRTSRRRAGAAPDQLPRPARRRWRWRSRWSGAGRARRGRPRRRRGQGARRPRRRPRTSSRARGDRPHRHRGRQGQARASGCWWSRTTRTSSRCTSTRCASCGAATARTRSPSSTRPTATRRSLRLGAAPRDRPRHGRPLHAGHGRVHARRADEGRPGAARRSRPRHQRGRPPTRVRARESLGIDVYLQKPVQFADMIATVRTLLKLKA